MIDYAVMHTHRVLPDLLSAIQVAQDESFVRCVVEDIFESARQKVSQCSLFACLICFRHSLIVSDTLVSGIDSDECRI